MKPAEAIVYGMIVQAAETGAVCPTNVEICAACGFASFGSSARAVQNLEAEGLITVERFSRSRVATVVATGKATARPIANGFAREKAAAAARRSEMAELIAEGAGVEEAGRLMNVGKSRAWQLWSDIKREMGWQAC